MTNVAVLGGYGMLGRALVALLVEQPEIGHVAIVDNNSRADRPWDYSLIQSFGPKAELHHITISPDEDAVNALTRGLSKYQIVINLAADVGGVFYNRANQRDIYLRNAILQTVPVTAAERAGVDTFIQTSSVCVYQPHYGVRPPSLEHSLRVHSELDALGIVSPDNTGYALAKRAGETLAFKSSIPRVMVVRPTNMFGPGDYYDSRAHVIPALIRAAYAPHQRVILRSPGKIERDFLSTDVAAQYLWGLLLYGRDRETYNLPGLPDGRVTMEQLAELICDIAGAVKPIVTRPSDGTAYEWSRRVDGDLIQSLFDVNNFLVDVPTMRDSLVAAAKDFLKQEERGV